MNNQRDTQRTSLNIYEKSSVPDNKLFIDLPVSGVINKRTEKLVTALYLVSDYMDETDPIRSKLRLLGVELLSDTYKINLAAISEKHQGIVVSVNRIHEINSLIESACNIGLISEMNADILKKEFYALTINLEQIAVNEKQFSFSLDSRMFDLGLTKEDSYNNKVSDKNFGADRQIKDRENHKIGGSPLHGFDGVKKTSHSIPSPKEKEDRQTKILSLVKDKKEVSIKDISLAFIDCSEKTIQRELNTLVSKGQIKKTGSKRWSKYSIIEQGESK